MKRYLFILLALCLALAGCASGEGSRSLTGSWKLTSYGPVDSPAPALPDVDATVTFDADGGVGGGTGCNQIGGTYVVSGSEITFESVVSTLIACPDPQMDQEAAILRVLSDTATYSIQGSTLTITNKDFVLTFTAAGAGA